MSGFDMHIHTNASDGKLNPAEIIDFARNSALDGIAITDHDTVANLEAAVAYAAEVDYPLIPGIEISAEWGNRDIHILGYWVDYKQEEFLAELALFQNARRDRCLAIVDRLQTLGMPLDGEAIVDGSGSSTGRPHIAKAMVEAGYAITMREAFQKWLNRGMPAYIARRKYCPFKAIEVIRKAGGAPVLAHPGVGVPDPLADQLARRGLAGIEVYHPDHTRRMEQKYLKFARFYRIAATGGSDFHGNRERPIGYKTTSLQQLELLARLR